MTKLTINIGTADKGDGDPLRVAFNKVNENFTELYNALGLDSGLLNLGAFEFTDSVMTTTDSTPIVIDQATTITSNLTVGGNILPQTANGGDLGSLARPFRSLYVSNNTVYLGGVPLSLDTNNNLTVNGSPVTGGGNSFNQDLNTDDNVTFDSVGATTVNVSQINGTNPGDELVIQANNNNWNFGTDGALTLPGTAGVVDRLYSDNGGYRTKLEKKIESSPTAGAIAKLELDLDNGHIRLAIGNYTGGNSQWIGNTWAFRDNGELTLPPGGDILNSNGDSVLGGGSYTPDDLDNWNDPTVNTVAAALDELAAKVAALENFEIDGGNAYTPAAGELIIDGNGA